MSLRVAPLSRDELVRDVDRLAELRIRVFAAWPYLYDGDRDYEARYLRTYLDSPRSVVVGARDGEHLVGAATGTPLEDHAAEFATAFEGSGIPLTQVFYCAESVLLPEYRGRGIGHRFFDLREAHARALGRRYACFCAVLRPADHPARPADYRPLDGFWKGRGYAPLPGAIARFRWKDHDDTGETEKPMQFWLRDLREEHP